MESKAPIQAEGKTLEELFLKIFKNTVLILMAIALVAVIILIPVALYKYMQAPKAIAPVQVTPERAISVEDLKKFLIEQEKVDSNKSETKAPASGESTRSLLYDEQVRAIYRCTEAFGVAAGITIESSNSTELQNLIESIRAQVERVASNELRGAPWVDSAAAFICSALKDPELIALRKDGKVKKVFFPAINFHGQLWDRNKQARATAQRNEEARFERETADEALRITLSKLQAIQAVTAAGVLFGFFMFMALYLIAAKIENNLREISVNTRRDILASPESISANSNA